VVTPSTPADMKGLLKAAIRDDNPVLVMPHRRCSTPAARCRTAIMSCRSARRPLAGRAAT
jgi:pyruvate/2-oxoglutarate/acetoin dehydrogenase E1 component